MNEFPVMPSITIEEIRITAKRIQPLIHRTSVLTCSFFNDLLGCTLFFKCENFQKVGAFKFRGASNAIVNLPQKDMDKGVATHSSGNHAVALTLAASNAGVKSYIVMPENSPEIKKKAVTGYGGEVTYCYPSGQAREETLQKVIHQTGATLIHPYDNPYVICGQGTASIEFLEEVGDLDYLIVPVGGGGLLSGTIIGAKGTQKGIKVFGAEPDGANDAFRSFQEKILYPSENPDTIADGLLTSLGKYTWPIIRDHGDGIITTTENSIIIAMRHIWERMKIIIEPSAAVPLAALLERKLNVRGKKVGIILSGGNVDLGKLPF